MRHLNTLTDQEILEINNILKNEYNYSDKFKLTHWTNIEYKCFGKSHAIYSGYAVVKVNNYLMKQNIDIFKQ